MVIGVTGGRDNNISKDMVHAVLEMYEADCVAVGCANGVDKAFRLHSFVPVVLFKANWSIGKRAGYIRNKELCEYLKSQGGVLVAFKGGVGTALCVQIANELGVKVEFAQN